VPQETASGGEEDRAQRYIFIAGWRQHAGGDRRSPDGDKLSSFGRPGRMAGNFKWVHNMTIDSRAPSIRPRVGDGRRAQKFKRQN
jgi:hypothetical protein